MNDLDIFIKGFTDEKLCRLKSGLMADGMPSDKAVELVNSWHRYGWETLTIMERRAVLIVISGF